MIVLVEMFASWNCIGIFDIFSVVIEPNVDWLVAAIPSMFGILAYNDLMSIVTKIEFTGTEKLFTLLMKGFLSFIYKGICFTTGWRW